MLEIVRTSIFPDPVMPSRYIRGVMLCRSETSTRYHGLKMEVWFYYSKKDKEPYFKTAYELDSKYADETFVAYHRRPLYRGLLNKMMAKQHSQ